MKKSILLLMSFIFIIGAQFAKAERSMAFHEGDQIVLDVGTPDMVQDVVFSNYEIESTYFIMTLEAEWSPGDNRTGEAIKTYLSPSNVTIEINKMQFYEGPHSWQSSYKINYEVKTKVRLSDECLYRVGTSKSYNVQLTKFV